MDFLFVAWLFGVLRKRRQRTYTPEQIEQIKREAAARGVQPVLEAPNRPYKWWRYEGLH